MFTFKKLKLGKLSTFLTLILKMSDKYIIRSSCSLTSEYTMYKGVEYSPFSRDLLGSSSESVLVHLRLPGDCVSVHLGQLGSFPIICQLIRAAWQVEPAVPMLGFCHLDIKTCSSSSSSAQPSSAQAAGSTVQS